MQADIDEVRCMQHVVSCDAAERKDGWLAKWC
jgi:hypothetical protein